ncbi:MAG: DUF167 domain-containing protein [Acidobacteriaceae bacterium]
MIPIHNHPLGATFAVRVQPHAARTAIAGTVGDALKLSVTAPALEDKANAAVVEYLAEVFAVPRATVHVVAGDRSRNKVIRVAGRTASELEQSLRRHFSV